MLALTIDASGLRAVIAKLKKRAAVARAAALRADNRLHVVPPCIVTDDELARALAVYDEAFAALG